MGLRYLTIWLERIFVDWLWYLPARLEWGQSKREGGKCLASLSLRNWRGVLLFSFCPSPLPAGAAPLAASPSCPFFLSSFSPDPLSPPLLSPGNRRPWPWQVKGEVEGPLGGEKEGASLGFFSSFQNILGSSLSVLFAEHGKMSNVCSVISLNCVFSSRPRGEKRTQKQKRGYEPALPPYEVGGLLLALSRR